VKALKYLVALWVVILVYSLLSFFMGPAGLSAYDQLKTEEGRQQGNLAALERINRELEGEKLALSGDPETIRVRARELGYGSREERFIRIVGLSRTVRPPRDAGQVIAVRSPEFLEDSTIRVISLISGGVTLVFLLIYGALKMLV
jgi:cell division protein FtsB